MSIGKSVFDDYVTVAKVIKISLTPNLFPKKHADNM